MGWHVTHITLTCLGDGAKESKRTGLPDPRPWVVVSAHLAR